jgi:hypothetical protein
MLAGMLDLQRQLNRKEIKGKKPTANTEVVGAVGVFHYPDSYYVLLPRGGTTWGGGSNNRATRYIMAVKAAVIDSTQ